MQTSLHFLISCFGSAALVLCCGCRTQPSAGTGSSFKGPVGLQLYSLRDQFNKDVPRTLDEVKSFVIKYAELAGTYKVSPDQFKQQLAARGIEAVSAHLAYERFRDDPEDVA